MNLSSPCLLKIPKNWSNKLISCNKCSTLVIPRWPFKIPHSSCNNEAKSFVSALPRLVFRALFFNEFENTSLSQDTIVLWMSENTRPHKLCVIIHDSWNIDFEIENWVLHIQNCNFKVVWILYLFNLFYLHTV